MSVELRAVHENCSGCCACRLACALENFGEVNPTKGALSIQGRFPSPGDYRIMLCDQCGRCAEVCPVEAIHQEQGTYILDREACTGCMACVEACPHGVMFVHHDVETPFKCTCCGECASVCPRGAIVIIHDQDRDEVT